MYVHHITLEMGMQFMCSLEELKQLMETLNTAFFIFLQHILRTGLPFIVFYYYTNALPFSGWSKKKEQIKRTLGLTTQFSKIIIIIDLYFRKKMQNNAIYF